MFVRMWMTVDVITIAQDAPLQDAARLLSRNSIRRLPVLSSATTDATLVGILSAGDVRRVLPARLSAAELPDPKQQAARVRDAMTRDPLTTTPDAPIEEAAALLRTRKIGALPVMRGAKLVGLITESDIFRAFSAMFDLSARGARVTFDIAPNEDVLPFIVQLAKTHGLRITSFVSLHALEHPMCVVHVAGTAIDAMLEDVWKSKHRVASVIHTGP